MRFFKRRKPEPSAREQVDAWLAWLVLDGKSPHTIDGYRQTTNKFLERWPELTLPEFTDEHILGFIEEANLPSRQQRRGCFSNLFGWAYRTRRVPFNPMHHIPTYKQQPQPPIEVFTEAECKVLSALPAPDGVLMALLLGSGVRKAEARSLTVRRIDFELRCLGATADDTLDDLFPGSGVMGETFEWFCRQGTLAIPKARNAAGARAEANRLRRTHDPLPGFDSPASVPEGAEFYRKVETA